MIQADGGLAAVCLRARRAMRVDPSLALRYPFRVDSTDLQSSHHHCPDTLAPVSDSACWPCGSGHQRFLDDPW